MKIHYRIKNNTIEIIRCYGTDDRIVLPEEINGLPVVSAAPYAFSAHKDGEEDAETWESEDAFSFGEERLLAGEEVQEIVFPDTLKEIGRYIFYGCKKLERLEFSEERNTLVRRLPLGWKQKLAFSVSIFHEPKIVFLDEPTGGVDPATRRQFWELIYQAADRGITIFVTTHYMDEAEYCNRVSIMVDGRIDALDTPYNLKKQFGADHMDGVFQQLARKAIRKAD